MINVVHRQACEYVVQNAPKEWKLSVTKVDSIVRKYLGVVTREIARPMNLFFHERIQGFSIPGLGVIRFMVKKAYYKIYNINMLSTTYSKRLTFLLKKDGWYRYYIDAFEWVFRNYYMDDYEIRIPRRLVNSYNEANDILFLILREKNVTKLKFNITESSLNKYYEWLVESENREVNRTYVPGIWKVSRGIGNWTFDSMGDVAAFIHNRAGYPERESKKALKRNNNRNIQGYVVQRVD